MNPIKPRRRRKRATALLSLASIMGSGRARATVNEPEVTTPLIQQVKFGVQAGASAYCGSPTETTGHFRCADFYDLSIQSRTAPNIGLHLTHTKMHSVTDYAESPQFDRYENQEDDLTGLLIGSQFWMGSFHLDGAIGPMGGNRRRSVYQEDADGYRKTIRISTSSLSGIGATLDLGWEILRHRALGTVDLGIREVAFAANHSDRPKDSRDVLYTWPMLSVGWTSRP